MTPGRVWLALAHLPSGELPVQASNKGCSGDDPELSQEPQGELTKDFSAQRCLRPRSHCTLHLASLLTSTRWKDNYHWFSKSHTSPPSSIPEPYRILPLPSSSFLPLPHRHCHPSRQAWSFLSAACLCAHLQSSALTRATCHRVPLL